jgi:lysophospholipase L1-like esterase
MAPRPKLLLLGDSLTQEGTDPSLGGWVCQVQHRYARSADVVVRGLYGYTTEMFVHHALPSVKSDLSFWGETPVFVTLWLGGNDSALLSGHEAALHVPTAQYRANLQTIVHAVRDAAPKAGILMVTPPAVNDQARLELSGDGKLDFSNDGTAAYAQACIEQAKILGVSVLDVHSTMNELSEGERLACQYDGLHLSSKGHALVAANVVAAIERAFPAMHKRLGAWEHPDYLELVGQTENS